MTTSRTLAPPLELQFGEGMLIRLSATLGLLGAVSGVAVMLRLLGRLRVGLGLLERCLVLVNLGGCLLFAHVGSFQVPCVISSRNMVPKRLELLVSQLLVGLAL